jgi:uncharacterized ubiquitin-like protein YukD
MVRMGYVMVTFRAGNRVNIDLKVPSFVPVDELLGMLSEALGITVGRDNRIQAEPLGRILDNNRTLEDEGVAHGALLTLI